MKIEEKTKEGLAYDVICGALHRHYDGLLGGTGLKLPEWLFLKLLHDVEVAEIIVSNPSKFPNAHRNILRWAMSFSMHLGLGTIGDKPDGGDFVRRYYLDPTEVLEKYSALPLAKSKAHDVFYNIIHDISRHCDTQQVEEFREMCRESYQNQFGIAFETFPRPGTEAYNAWVAKELLSPEILEFLQKQKEEAQARHQAAQLTPNQN